MPRGDDEMLLSGYRALEIGDEKVLFCGKLLADLGVDVIKVEKPGGDQARNFGPFIHDIPAPERSLYWLAYNTSKRSITLNIETEDGREIFKRLVRTADFVLESFAPGYLDSLGLGYSALERINPRIVVTSVTPFGQTGPYRNYKASDMVVWALGGQMYRMGDEDLPPVQYSFPQAYIDASAEAAVGTLVAHYHREMTGEGQHVDVSAQDHVARLSVFPLIWWDLARVIFLRKGASLFRVGGASTQQIWRCKDGHVGFAIRGALAGAHVNRALVEWMDSEGMAPDFLKSIDWASFSIHNLTQQDYDRIEEPIQRFFLTHTKAELYEEARRREIVIMPTATVQDIDASPHLEARGFWQYVDYPALGITIKHPGEFVKVSEGRLRQLQRAPLVGEHNEAVYGGELGMSKSELCTLREVGAI